jgi:hypothetical protein
VFANTIATLSVIVDAMTALPNRRAREDWNVC